jgi:hypothetical protein
MFNAKKTTIDEVLKNDKVKRVVEDFINGPMKKTDGIVIIYSHDGGDVDYVYDGLTLGQVVLATDTAHAIAQKELLR